MYTLHSRPVSQLKLTTNPHNRTQYVYISEIFPNHLRPQGVALGIAAFYLGSEITLIGAPVALNEIGWKFYLVLICPSVVYIGLIWFL